jgi:hypothetical protein
VIAMRRIQTRLGEESRRVSALAAMLAVVWALVLPGIHAIECGGGESCSACEHDHELGQESGDTHHESPAPHDHKHCPICQFIAMMGTVGGVIDGPRAVPLEGPSAFVDAAPVASVRSRTWTLALARGPPRA